MQNLWLTHKTAVISMTYGSESGSRLVPLTAMVGLGQINQPYLPRSTAVPQLYSR